METSIISVENELLEDGTRYTGSAYRLNGKIIPHGYGRKNFSDYYGIGRFVDGVLEGPVYVNHDYYMYTCMMKKGKPYGWSLMINGGYPFFHVVINGDEKEDLSDAILWYFDKLKYYGRKGKMFHCYPKAGEIFIGYPGEAPQNGIGLSFSGFHFMNDGDVWVGTTNTLKKTGDLLHFRNDGTIEIGTFENGALIVPKTIQDVINQYWGYIDFDLSDEFSLMMFSDEYREKHSSKNSPYKDVRLDLTRNYYLENL